MRMGEVPSQLLQTLPGVAAVNASDAHVAYLHWSALGQTYWITPLRGKRHNALPEHAKQINEDVTDIITSFLRAQLRYLGGDTLRDYSPETVMEGLKKRQAVLYGELLTVVEARTKVVDASASDSHTAMPLTMWQERYVKAASCDGEPLNESKKNGFVLACHMFLNSKAAPFTSATAQNAISNRSDLPKMFDARHEAATACVQASAVWPIASSTAMVESVARNMETSPKHLQESYAVPFQDGAIGRLRGHWFEKLAKNQLLFGVRILPMEVVMDATGGFGHVHYAPALVQNPPLADGCIVSFLERATRKSKADKVVWRMPTAGVRSQIPSSIIDASSQQSVGQYRFSYDKDAKGYTQCDKGYISVQHGGPCDGLVEKAMGDWQDVNGIDDEDLIEELCRWRRRGTSLSVRPRQGNVLMEVATGTPYVVRSIITPKRVWAFQLRQSGLDNGCGRWRRLCEVEVESQLTKMDVVTHQHHCKVTGELFMHHVDWVSTLQEPAVVELRAGGGLDGCSQPQPRRHESLADGNGQRLQECWVDVMPAPTSPQDGVQTRKRYRKQQQFMADEEAAQIMTTIASSATHRAASPGPMVSPRAERMHEDAAATSLLNIALARQRVTTRSNSTSQ